MQPDIVTEVGERRITITLPYATYTALAECADAERRSMSGQAAVLLSDALMPRRGNGDGGDGGGE